MRFYVGVTMGILFAAAAAAALHAANRALFLPATPEFFDGAAVIAAPMTAKAVLCGGWFLAALVGGLVAVRVGHRPAAGWIVAGLVAVAGAAACVLLLPGLLWMQVAAFVAPLAAGLVVQGAAGNG